MTSNRDQDILARLLVRFPNVYAHGNFEPRAFDCVSAPKKSRKVSCTESSTVSVLLSTILMASSIGQMSTPLSAAYQAAEAVGIFHTIIDFPKPIHSVSKDTPAGGDIVLQNVNFAYPGRPEVKVLDNLNMLFPAGKVTAIVGPSGAGKSTIVGIIERWYEFNGDPVTNPLVGLYPTPMFCVSALLMSHRYFGVGTGS